MRKILEQSLVALLNEDKEQADKLLHQFILERSREIHESNRHGEEFVVEDELGEGKSYKRNKDEGAFDRKKQDQQRRQERENKRNIPVTEAEEDKLWYTSSSGSVEFHMEEEDVRAIAKSGDNLAAVEAVMAKPYMKTQLDQQDADAIRETLSEFGAWDEEQLADDEENLRRIVWEAAWSIFEDEEYQDRLNESDGYLEGLMKRYPVGAIVEVSLDTKEPYDEGVIVGQKNLKADSMLRVRMFTGENAGKVIDVHTSGIRRVTVDESIEEGKTFKRGRDRDDNEDVEDKKRQDKQRRKEQRERDSIPVGEGKTYKRGRDEDEDVEDKKRQDQQRRSQQKKKRDEPIEEGVLKVSQGDDGEVEITHTPDSSVEDQSGFVDTEIDTLEVPEIDDFDADAMDLDLDAELDNDLDNPARF